MSDRIRIIKHEAVPGCGSFEVRYPDGSVYFYWDDLPNRRLRPFVFYTGTYECSDGKWIGEMISQEHTPTTRPMAERVQRIGFSGTYNDAGAEADPTVLVGKSRIRYDATLHLLAAA